MQVPTEPYIMLSMVLFALGVMGVLLRRNAILVFMSVELMLNAANLALAAFARVRTPPLMLNLAGPELLSVRRVAEQFGQLFDKPVTIQGTESADALLSNGQEGHRLFGYPRVTAGQMIHWIADWVRRGGASLGKPTHFEVRDGKF